MHKNDLNEIGWEGVDGVYLVCDCLPTSIAGV